jgi:hypothetical protein
VFSQTSRTSSDLTLDSGGTSLKRQKKAQKKAQNKGKKRADKEDEYEPESELEYIGDNAENLEVGNGYQETLHNSFLGKGSSGLNPETVGEEGGNMDEDVSVGGDGGKEKGFGMTVTIESDAGVLISHTLGRKFETCCVTSRFNVTPERKNGCQ